MIWTLERKREAAIQAPLGRSLVRDDSRLIVRPGWYQIVTPSAKGYLNEVTFSQVAPGDVERVIDETIATYRGHGIPTKWCVGPWTKPDDFGDRLVRRGFRSWDVRGMGCDTDRLPRTGRQISVEEVTEENFEGYHATAFGGWKTPPDEERLDRRAHLEALRTHPRTVHLFLAKVGAEASGTAGLFMRDGYAYLVGGQVLDQARGRGVYRALVDARLAFLASRSIQYAVTHAREETSAPMLEHLGFETLFRSKCYVLD